MTESIWSHDQPPPPPPLVPSPKPVARQRSRSVFRLLVQREISPKTKSVPRKRWGVRRCDTADSPCGTSSETVSEQRHNLISWVEAESLQHLSADYCPLVPPPRSTIAAAFSSDGRTLASTHGDHTVKIIDCETGKCLKVLSGHRRTPWVVRFHPRHSEIVASGSLDHEVRLWNAITSECIRSHDFYRPIASIAFHAEGDILAVASGHKLHIWHYNKTGEDATPAIVLKTRRSLRAVHFHPHGVPLLLTAEVTDIDSSDSAMTRATSPGYLRYPPPAIFFTNTQSGGSHTSMAAELPLVPLPYLLLPSYSPDDPRIQYSTAATGPRSAQSRFQTRTSTTAVDAMDIDEAQPVGGGNRIPRQVSSQSDLLEFGQFQQLFHSRDRVSWEVPFLQGWLMAQSQAGVLPTGSSGTAPPHTGSSSASHTSTASLEAAVASLEIPGGEAGADAQPVVNRLPSELASSIAAAELPCTVKLRVWAHDIKDPCAILRSDKCRLTIHHAVLCSEMGAHFSPCGRYLAACVACVIPHAEADPGLQTLVQQDSGLATSPTRHPVTAHQVMYELRVYSLEKETFGSVLVSRAIRAAHCLTSIQFSPNSEHILLAYGRRHGSLLKSIVSDGETTSHFFTVLEIYRVADMELVRILPSSEDEVNVACFHPSPGGGLVYGTKEGKLRIFRYNTAAASNLTAPNSSPEENLAEVQTYALEC
ncbi:BnaA08g27710D [Brassica napus]|uniref:BnaA08g27710D protein n=1 Tax=Brassica napus TaxID=3708 RepID=A0A078FRK8_BRANA|nr:BnaA08g27710D [Brassica napus]